MEDIKSRQHNNGIFCGNFSNNAGGNNNTYNNNPRRCYRCQATTHIAKYCPEINNNSNQNF